MMPVAKDQISSPMSSGTIPRAAASSLKSEDTNAMSSPSRVAVSMAPSDVKRMVQLGAGRPRAARHRMTASVPFTSCVNASQP